MVLRKDFDRLLVGVAPQHPSSQESEPTPVVLGQPESRWPIVLTLGVALLGVASILAGVLIAVTTPPGAAVAVAVLTTDAPTPVPEPTPVPAPDAAVMAIADLADSQWVERVSERAAIPPRALAAYAGAALSVASTHPHCGLGWNTLAAIGQVETEHGSIFGGAISAAGDTRPAIIGVQLNGAEFDAIADTDGGLLDGDMTWDRAVGPMQFIPATWTAFAQDGNGDGVTDIHQVDDAALTAAHYLCAVGDNVRLDDNWITAVGAYNSSIDYNNRVAAAASHYASLGHSAG